MHEIIKLWPLNDPVYWSGKYSEFKYNSAIENFINDYLKQNQPEKLFVIPSIDGFVNHPLTLEKDKTGIRVLDFSGSDPKMEEYGPYAKKNAMFGILCSRNYNQKNVIYLPLDDAIFENGLTSVIPQPPSWESRKSIAFWRGGFSGHPFVRGDVVKVLHNYPNTDVKLIQRWQWNHPISPIHIGEEASTGTYMQHKYILIVDGGVIASSHQWVMGSGAVPIFVTHPDNNWWFKDYLEDGYNCIMVGYDMDLLKQKIDWLVANDDKAKEIAQNAKKLSDSIFTSEYQKQYLINELAKLQRPCFARVFEKQE